MTLRTGYQNKIFHSLINELKLDAETKEELVYNFTLCRTKSSAEMHWLEMEQLITALRQRLASPTPTLLKREGVSDPAQKMRRKILSMCHEVHVTKWSEAAQKNVIDFARLNAWIAKYGHAKHKTLNEYSVAELPKLVTQFEQVYKHYFKA